jgi:hypothetical protein
MADCIHEFDICLVIAGWVGAMGFMLHVAGVF